MSFFNKFSEKIESQNWSHVTFLRNILLLLSILLLFFYIWLLFLQLNGVVSSVYFDQGIISLLQGNLFGIISGVVVGFLILLPYYLKKQWDLHVVVPASLFVHLLIAIMIWIFNLYFARFSVLGETAYLIGYLIGGLIPILAYSGEVEKEHQDEEELLYDE